MHLENGIDYRILALYLAAFQSTTKFTTPISFCRVSLTANNLRLQIMKSPGSFETLVPASDIEMLGETWLSEFDG